MEYGDAVLEPLNVAVLSGDERICQSTTRVTRTLRCCERSDYESSDSRITMFLTWTFIVSSLSTMTPILLTSFNGAQRWHWSFIDYWPVYIYELVKLITVDHATFMLSSLLLAC